MQIKGHTEHQRLTGGDLVMAATGELHHVTKGDEGRTTWLERWSDEYGVTLTDDGVGSYADERLFPLTVVQVTAPGGVPLSDDERCYLAMHARYESNRQDDVRYWDADPQQRLVLKRRWREIADWLHPEPWGEQPTQRVALTGVEDGRITAWNAGHVRPVRVFAGPAGDVLLVECPDRGRDAIVDGQGHIRCRAVSSCGGAWRVAVEAVYSEASTPTGGLE